MCINVRQIVARPNDYSDEKLSYGYKYGEESYDNVETETQESASRYGTTIFTNYPDTPYESVDKRKRSIKETDLLVEKLNHGNDQSGIRPQRETENESKIPLNSLIGTIEAEIVHSADAINAQVARRGRRSSPKRRDTIDQQNNDDVNKNLFEGIFEYTRPQRETNGDAKKTVSLREIVDAVEDTLVHSAEKINSPVFKRNAEVESISNEHEHLEENIDRSDDRSGKEIHLLKIAPNKQSDLTLLNPITFKTPKRNTDESNEDKSNEVSTVAAPILGLKKEKIATLHSSENTHIIKEENDQVGHIQHQKITQTVFKSNLPILSPNPTKNIQISEPTTEKDVKSEKEKTKLKEKIAEVGAVPIILSTGL